MSTALKLQPREEKLISVDSHVLYTDEWVMPRLPERLRPRWTEAVKKYQAESARKMGGFMPNINDIMDPEAWNDPGHTEPHAKLKAMDRDGVWAEVIFPELSGSKLCTPQMMGADWKEMLSGLNDAIGDFAGVNTERLLCAYQMMPFDVDWAVKEVDRIAKKGGRCIQLPPYPHEFGLKDYYHEDYKPMWKAIEEAGLVVLQHLETTEDFYEIMSRDPTPVKGIAMGMPALKMQEVFAFWLLTGVLEEHPKLKVIMVEPGLGWLPFLFEVILDGRIKQGHYSFPKLKMLPSEYFKRQMGATFMFEPYGLKMAYEYFGPDVLYWSTDFPHPATCWPKSKETIETQFSAAGIKPDDRYKIVCGNAMKTFGFS